MAGNSFGNLFRITTCGESHGGALGVIIDGCPAGIKINAEEIQLQLDRRKPGQSSVTSSRKEEDLIHIMSGVFEGVTTGTPILLLAYNNDQQPKDYEQLKNLYRPSHADFTYQHKYGIRDYRGSGRASARETLARVAAGTIAQKFLKEKLKIEIISYVEQVGNIDSNIDHTKVKAITIEQNIIRCPDAVAAIKMIDLIEKLKQEGDSIGGIIKCVIRNTPIGLGAPVFDRISADLAKAMLSINACKGFELGSGFAGVALPGSLHNDPFGLDDQNNPIILKNDAGGVLGGISSGADIYFRAAFKSVSTISKPQNTIDLKHNKTQLMAIGRHDPCVLARVVPVVDAMSALVLIDHYLMQQAYM